LSQAPVWSVWHFQSAAGTTYRLGCPGKLLATESFYSGAPYIAFIDRDRNAFVVADANSISGSQSVSFVATKKLLVAK
jgi:hypothetical protein